MIMRFLSNNSVAAVLCKVLSAILTLIFTWSVAVVLSIEEAGIFLYTYTVMMVLVQLSRAGTEHSIIKWLSGDNAAVSYFRIIRKITFYVFVMSVLFSVFYYTLVKLNVFDAYSTTMAVNTLVCFIGVVICFSVLQVLGSYFQSQGQVYRQYWCMSIAISLVGCAVSLISYLSTTPINVYDFSLLFLDGSIICLLLAIVFCYFSLRNTKSTNTEIKSRYDETLWGLIKFTFPFSILAFITIIIQWGSSIISGVWLIEGDLALLAISIRLGVLVNFIFLAFNSLLAPKFSSLYEQGDTSLFQEKSDVLVAISSAFSIGLFLFYAFFGSYILSLFGELYTKAYIPMLVISFCWMLRVIIGPVDVVLLMTNNVKVSRRNLLIASVLSVVLSFSLIPLIGVMGAAVAAGISGLSLSLLNNASASSLFNVNYCNVKSLARQYTAVKNAINLKLEN